MHFPRLQLLAASSLLFIVFTAIIGLDLLARNNWLRSWMERQEEKFCRETKTCFWNDGYFADAEDRLLNEELPAADYSKGGVYFVGASNLRGATRFWELPEEQRALVHNYAISRSSHSDEFQFLRYLVEQEGLLRARAEKTLVVFGVTYGEIEFKYDPEDYFVKLWERHGLYVCLPEGIRPIPVNPQWRFLHFERVRIAGCLTKLRESLIRQVRLYRGVTPQNKHKQEFYNQRPLSFSEQHWNEDLYDQLAEFNRMLDYLTTRNVNVVVVILPYGSWEHKWHFERTYTSEVGKICKSRQIPLYDWSTLLEDDDFEDSCHPNVLGAEKLQAGFLKIALPFLRSTHALPNAGLPPNIKQSQ